LLLSTRHSDTPALGYMGAAQAAQQLGDTRRRDHHLEEARETDQRLAVRVGLQEAELELESGEIEKAAKTLEALRHRFPRHERVLKLSMDTYRLQQDWQSLWRILPDIRRRRVVSEAEFKDLEREISRELLASRAKSGDRAELERAWSDTRRQLRTDPDLVVDYAGYLESHGAAEEALRLLRKTVSRHWHSKLVLAYGEISRGDAALQMKTVEGWLKSRADDPDLLLTAGRVARRNRLWGKARSFYEASIAQRPTPDGYQELGSLLEQLEEPEKARDCYRNGLQLMTGRELTTASTVLEFKPGEEEGTSAESEESSENAPAERTASG
jgi:HemY protein